MNFRNATITSVDGMLAEFEKIVKKDVGKAKAFSANPFSCVEFSKVFKGLGYETAPHKDLRWKERKMHTVASYFAQGKRRLGSKLSHLLQEVLLEDEGMVRCSFAPRSAIPKAARPF